ncbi:MAG: response regulator transcription factor [Betaproteobacteria bacterium]|nr:response regulator transcription factor [Betaproteobacteria bacterium]
MQRRVLLVEDHSEISDLVRLHLRDLDCSVTVAADGLAGVAEAESKKYDLVILDIMLPGMDGIAILRRLRSKSMVTPVLMLTSKSTELDRVLGLEMGADDYLTKPFSVMELMARVKALFRRVDAMASHGEEAAKPLVFGRLRIDPERRTVTLDQAAVELTAKEFDLLYYFAKNLGRVFTRSQLLDRVWGYTHSGYEHTVNSHINRLRAKIERDAAHPDYVLTVWGVGYKFTESGG